MTGPTVVDVDGGRVVGGGSRRGAVEAIVGGAGAIVVGLVAAVVGGTVETDTGTVDDVLEAVVFVVVVAAGIDLVLPTVVGSGC